MSVLSPESQARWDTAAARMRDPHRAATDYGTGVVHCPDCCRPICAVCGSCHQLNLGADKSRRWICQGCGARVKLVYPTGEDDRRYRETYAVADLLPCWGCGGPTDMKKDGTRYCGPCIAARKKGYKDRRDQREARLAEDRALLRGAGQW